jgi:predicted nucleic acid-binding protein
MDVHRRHVSDDFLGEERSNQQVSRQRAVSFAVIRALALDGAFSFDRDFRDGGVVVYPGPS